MHAFEFERLGHVDFNDDLFGALNERCRVAKRGGRDDMTVFGNRASFDDSNVDFATEVAITGHLRHMAEMEVKIIHLSAVEFFAHRIISLIR